MNCATKHICILFCALYAGIAAAQTPPDAGQILQHERKAPEPPRPSPSIVIPQPAATPLLPGGARVRIKRVQFTRNSVFSSERLGTVLGNVAGQSLDMAGLQALARKVTTFYRNHGYPFATAYLPAQKLADGVLTITVLEGRYGQVKAKGDSRLAAHAQRFLSRLKPGEVIETTSLERSTLILNDLPGISAAPLIRPGQAIGTGDLIVNVARKPAFTGELGGDNHGNRFTGEYRARANLQWSSPFIFGDQLALTSFLSNEGQWLGNIDYSLPLGVSGLRGRVGYAHTRYELGKQFKTLNANGTVDMVTVGADYPIIRSQQRNLTLAGDWQHKRLEDKQDATNTRNNKRSDVLPLTLRFDLRDGLFGGGLSYGSLTWTAGDLHLDAALKASDVSTARTDGHFRKWNLDVVRVQSTPLPKLSLYGRFTGQLANKNLDSSEEFGLGGPYGVRAYPVGEGFGDEGWLAQVEARYRMGSLAPYLFYDAGRVKINENTWTSGRNHRSIAGAGVGLRYSKQAFNIDASVAWHTGGGRPISDKKNRNPRGWVTAGWRF